MPTVIVPVYPNPYIKKELNDEYGYYGGGGAVVTTPPSNPIENLFGTRVPATPINADGDNYTLGMKFQVSVDGNILGVRFYKGDTTNGGTHIGALYDNAGNLLASKTFSGETSSGWQEQLFDSPVAITANTTYIVAYLCPQGHYGSDAAFFQTSAFVNGHIIGIQSQPSSDNGLFHIGNTLAFPTDSFNFTNYNVDVIFQQT